MAGTDVDSGVRYSGLGGIRGVGYPLLRACVGWKMYIYEPFGMCNMYKILLNTIIGSPTYSKEAFDKTSSDTGFVFAMIGTG